jgi:hypothetical protein
MGNADYYDTVQFNCMFGPRYPCIIEDHIYKYPHTN